MTCNIENKSSTVIDNKTKNNFGKTNRVFMLLRDGLKIIDKIKTLAESFFLFLYCVLSHFLVEGGPANSLGLNICKLKNLRRKNIIILEEEKFPYFSTVLQMGLMLPDYLGNMCNNFSFL